MFHADQHKLERQKFFSTLLVCLSTRAPPAQLIETSLRSQGGVVLSQCGPLLLCHVSAGGSRPSLHTACHAHMSHLARIPTSAWASKGEPRHTIVSMAESAGVVLRRFRSGLCFAQRPIGTGLCKHRQAIASTE